MNVDLLPSTFEPYRSISERQCSDCASWREHPVYIGWCLMQGRSRGATQSPVYIGTVRRVRTEEGRTVYLRPDGDAGLCFSPIVDFDAPEECIDRYVPVTRTENELLFAFDAKNDGR
jgi:hypothetical protein